MGIKCVICGIKQVKSGTVSFHSFPKDANRKKLWLTSCNLKLYLPSYRVCSNHFSPEQYLKNGLLKKESVPLCDHQQLEQSSCNILPQPHYTIKKEFISPTSRACHEPLISEHNYCTTMPNSVSTSLTKRRKIFNAVTIGDLEKYHFSTLSKARSHLKMVKDKYKEKQIQNQNLKQQNKRLRAKLPKYEQLITSLQS